MRILIVSLHVRRSAQAVPLAAANLKAALPDALRERTRLLDFTLEQSPRQILAALLAEKADLVAFSVYMWNRALVEELAAGLKATATPPFLLAGGPEASADPAGLLAAGCDAVLRGEGEEGFARLADSLRAGKSLGGIEGLCLAGATAEVAPAIVDVAGLPSPWQSGIQAPVEGGVLWEVARGCPFACSFCYDAKGVAGVRPLPFARLGAELEGFVRAGAEQVWVLDSTFNAPPRRGRALLQLLLEKAPQLHYHLEAKAEFVDAETIRLLQQLSCSVQLGLQSADSEVLAGLNRRIDTSRFWRGIELMAGSGLTFGLDLIYGLPGDSPAGFRASLARALACRPNQVDCFPLAVLPGTALADTAAEAGLVADRRPPYLLRESREFTVEQMHDCALLAAAVDLFYNRGRAVGFLLPFCDFLKRPPVEFLDDFAGWYRREAGEEGLLHHEGLSAAQLHALQREYLATLFGTAKGGTLWPLVADILEFHYQHAETLLGAETLPMARRGKMPRRLRLAAGVRIFRLRTDCVGALESEEIDLARWHKRIERVPCRVLTIRRGGQVFSELLNEEFAALLTRAAAGAAVEELGAGLAAAAAAELIEFAWQEGLLVADAAT